jgi:hypothetical protein
MEHFQAQSWLLLSIPQLGHLMASWHEQPEGESLNSTRVINPRLDFSCLILPQASAVKHDIGSYFLCITLLRF